MEIKLNSNFTDALEEKMGEDEDTSYWYDTYVDVLEGENNT